MTKGQKLLLAHPMCSVRFCTFSHWEGEKAVVDFSFAGRPTRKAVAKKFIAELTDENLDCAFDWEVNRRKLRATEAHEAGDPTATLLLSTYEIIAA